MTAFIAVKSLFSALKSSGESLIIGEIVLLDRSFLICFRITLLFFTIVSANRLWRLFVAQPVVIEIIAISIVNFSFVAFVFLVCRIFFSFVNLRYGVVI